MQIMKRNDDENDSVEMKCNLCYYCIIGKTVPLFVHENGYNVWKMCQIRKYNKHSGMFTIFSISGQMIHEDISIPSKPFTTYVSYFSQRRQTQKVKKGGYLSSNINNRSFLLPHSLLPVSTNYIGNNGDDDWSLDSYIHPQSMMSISSSSLLYQPKSLSSSLPSAPSPTKLIVTPAPAHSYSNNKRKRSYSSKNTRATSVVTTTKTIPRPWTTEEDQELIALVKKSNQGNNNKHISPKWSTEIAQSMSTERTGKQCRERYLNHLKPKLRFDDWSIHEDALLVRLYMTMGTKWSQMSKFMNGRTDNHIKNRFHHIRRKLEKDVSRIGKMCTIQQISCLIRLEHLPPTHESLKSNFSNSNETFSEFSSKTTQILPYLALDSMKATKLTMNNKKLITSKNEDRSQTTLMKKISLLPSFFSSPSLLSFGPMEEVMESNGTCCYRCNFIIPSYQTGRYRCKKTKWCEACTRIPSYVAGDLLRRCVNLRQWNEEG